MGVRVWRVPGSRCDGGTDDPKKEEDKQPNNFSCESVDETAFDSFVDCAADEK